MKDIRPCDQCGGKLSTGSYVVRTSLLLINANAINQTAGLSQMLGGHWGLAEVFSPDTDYVKVAMDEDSRLMTELVFCQQCVFEGLDLPSAMEKVNSDD